MREPQTMERNKVYFAGDFHLGTPTFEASLAREKMVVRWLEAIEADAAELFLLGDVFDFWFEYRYVVPKHFVRFLGTLARLSDAGCRVHFFCGNHDLWQKDYLEKEIGLVLHRDVETVELNGKTFLIGHGDGLDASDRKYRILRSIFRNPLCISAFAALHPRIAFALGRNWSRKSRKSHSEGDKVSLGKDEPLYRYCQAKMQQSHVDFFVFGHRHLQCDMALSDGSRYINTGLWDKQGYYAVWDGENLSLEKFE